MGVAGGVKEASWLLTVVGCDATCRSGLFWGRGGLVLLESSGYVPVTGYLAASARSPRRTKDGKTG